MIFLRKTYIGGSWAEKLAFLSEVNAISHLHNVSRAEFLYTPLRSLQAQGFV